MARVFYSLVHYLLLPVLMARLIWRSAQSPGYGANWWQRLGWAPRNPSGVRPIWLHAVSVGETIAAKPLVDQLRKRHPGVPIVVTGMTATGAERVRALMGNQVQQLYAPYDTPDIVGRFLTRVKPVALLVMETELWPNWIAGCANRRIPVLLLNGRMSEKSAKGYQKVSALSRPLFQSLTWVAAQTSKDAIRFGDLGVSSEALSINGSIKFDATPPPELREQAVAWRKKTLPDRMIWVAGSTHEGEESLLLAAHKSLVSAHPGLLLILVPRHPERFDGVAGLIEKMGLRFARRSQGGDTLSNVDVLLGDTMGELLYFYAACDIAFVGGSLIPRGGHNPLEPAMLDKPVLMGKHVFNFQVICDELQVAGALSMLDPDEFTSKMEALLTNHALRDEMGAAGKRMVEQNRGALERMLTGIEEKVPNLR